MQERESMQRDFRDTTWYRESLSLHEKLRRPGTGQISDALEVHGSPDGRHAVFSGVIMDRLEGSPTTRICRSDLSTGDTRVLTFGPHTDRLPRYSPDGRHVAFLSDRTKQGDFQLYLLDTQTGAALETPRVEGWVEYLHWSPNGAQILLGVAGHGADLSGGQGAISSKQAANQLPSWTPSVDAGDEAYRWRRAWVYDLKSAGVRRVSRNDQNVWEAVWCGNRALATVTSPGPSEGLWYTARLELLEVETGITRELFKPRTQIGVPNASPSGRQIAFVEAICSDRWYVAGNVRVIDAACGEAISVDTHGVDVTYTEWRSETELLLAGHRGFETVVGVYDSAAGVFSQKWSSSELSVGGFFVTVAALKDADCVLIGEGYRRAPEVAVIRQGEYVSVRSFDLGYREAAKAIDEIRQLTWRAPDGLEIQGWLLRPKSDSRPQPLVMFVHGGPVWHWHPVWLGRRYAPVLLLLQRGYAVFFPNPRGSTGRGQEFVRGVLGDMGGADTHDYLSGLDHLVNLRLADPERLGVTGGSYGGYMTAWLITQDSRFAAAVTLAPVTNKVSQHLISNIPEFVALFLADRYDNLGGKYFTRSPIMYARRARTPTLNICGALDRCTPPQEAVQFHNALREHGVQSVLLTYPEEGHAVRKYPAAIDYSARLVWWFEQHMPPELPVRGHDV